MKKFRKRIIARLDIKGSRLIKGIRFEGLRVIGNPCDVAQNYYKKGIDEIFYSDAVASLYGRNSLDKLLNDTCKSVFVPVTAGGAIKSVDDVYNLLKAGADKIAINTHAVKNPELITKLANRFGEQCITLSIQARRSFKMSSGWEVMIESGRERTGIDLQSWIEKSQKLGIGEIFLTSVDQDGTNKGPDEQLINMANKLVKKPLIVGGGFNTISTIDKFLKLSSVSGISIGSSFHYKKLCIQEIKEKINSKDFSLRISNSNKINFTKNKNKKFNIAVIDYGMGNQQSLINALNLFGHNICLTEDKDLISKSDLAILPGVGSFPAGIKELRNRGLINILLERYKNRKPIIGICLGMQLLFENSSEFSKNNGLGIFKGEIKNIKDLVIKDSVTNSYPKEIKLPHMGWNDISEYYGESKYKYIKELKDKAFYFVHNYGADSISNSDFYTITKYYGRDIVAICAIDNNVGFQFHPERSGIEGLNLLSKVIDNLLENKNIK